MSDSDTIKAFNKLLDRDYDSVLANYLESLKELSINPDIDYIDQEIVANTIRDWLDQHSNTDLYEKYEYLYNLIENQENTKGIGYSEPIPSPEAPEQIKFKEKIDNAIKRNTPIIKPHPPTPNPPDEN